MVDIELISAGSYKVLTPHPEGLKYNIIRSEWEGPKGGKRFIWEAAYLDPKAAWGPSWAIENYCFPAETLSEARTALAAFFESL